MGAIDEPGACDYPFRGAHGRFSLATGGTNARTIRQGCPRSMSSRPKALKATLADLLSGTARRHPDRVAVVDPDQGQLDYLALDALSDRLCDRFLQCGVRPGDRIGLLVPKSLGAVVGIFAALKAGAAYVPVDPTAPAERAAYIFADCTVRLLLVEDRLLTALGEALPDAKLDVLGELESGAAPGMTIHIVRPAWPDDSRQPASPEGLAYILYTSGSTGRPKGVMHSHATALSFIDWCTDAFSPDERDRFSSHAPFHFDLSILDLYVPIKHGAAVVLIGEDTGKQPLRLAPLIEEQAITVWYSTPSILRLLMDFGHLDGHRCEKLRLVLFAGEVFPIKHLQALQALWPHPRYCNLYGPTETNVCTWQEAPPETVLDRTETLPIGLPCSGDRTLVVDDQDQPAAPGAEGELLVTGGSVMLGYWNLPERDAAAFLVDSNGVRWYRTGDVVREQADGSYIYLGRRDRMVKRRGYRVELGEIESVLYRHPEITETAVIALPDEDSGVHIRAFLSWGGQGRPSLIALKRFAAENLPTYMVPDRFVVLDALPRTSTDKTDYQRLKEFE